MDNSDITKEKNIYLSLCKQIEKISEDLVYIEDALRIINQKLETIPVPDDETLNNRISSIYDSINSIKED